MSRKPTYEELEQRIRNLEEESAKGKRVEEALRENEERFRLTFQTSPDSININRLEDGMYVDINEGFTRLTGFTREDVIGKTSLSLNIWNDPEDRQELVRGLREKGFYSGLEARFRRKDGSVGYGLMSARVIVLHGVPHIISVTRDISDHKRAEEELRKERENLAVILENNPNGIVVIGREGKFLYVNPEFTKITGYTLRDVPTGKEWFRRAYPDPEFRKTVIDTWKEDYNLEGRNFDREFSVTCKEGEVKNILFRTTFMKNQAIQVFIDVTQQRRASEALRESEARFREMADLLPQAVYEANAQGILTYVNRYAFDLFGYTREDFEKGANVLQMLIPEDRYRAAGAIERVMKREISAGQLEFRALRKDGSSFPVEIYSSPIIRQGNGVGLRGILIDITERRRAEEERHRLRSQLLQAQKMEAIGSLAGGIAHDFNNILGAIIGYTELAQLEMDKKDRVSHNLDQIMKAGERARDLVKHMLSFARQGDLEFKPMKVGLVVKEVLNFLRASLPTSIEIQQNLQTEHDTILGDPTQIHQVLMNLGTNARHAMLVKGGTLEVILDEEDVKSQDQYPEIGPGHYVRLRLRDTGHGMSPKIMERIFNPYFTTKESGIGTGLGLAVVHGIVRKHGGAICVKSEPGEGATFTVLLPLLEEKVSSEHLQKEDIPKGEGRILFVDDEESLVDLGRGMLEQLGYQVIGRKSSLEALEAFRANPEGFDLVITDMTMPQMTGDRLAQEILKIRPEMLIIICTGFSERISDDRARQIGIKAFVLKPLLMREIGKKVKEVMEMRTWSPRT